MASKPRVFISSTIYDFKDLRSAIRFYLDSMGFDVVLSEMNDFDGPIEDNSFKACFRAIQNCEYFILLIGSRVGGYFNKEDKTSITQQEYRTAYEILKENKIKIISFVRKEIWTIRDDRKALSDFLKMEFNGSKEISTENIRQISMHSSKFVNDADFIFNFIDEVTRKNEMLEATKSGTKFPHGNWIYSFDHFDQIVSALRMQMNIFSSIQERIILENVKREIKKNLEYLFVQLEEEPEVFFYWIDFIKNIPIDDLDGETFFDLKKIERLQKYSAIGIGRGKHMSAFFINEALSSGIFQSKNYLTGDVEYSKLGEVVFKLFDEIDSLKKIETVFDRNQTDFLLRNKASLKEGKGRYINNLTLVPLKAARNVQETILRLSKVIINYIDGKEDELSQLNLNAIEKKSLNDAIIKILNSKF